MGEYCMDSKDLDAIWNKVCNLIKQYENINPSQINAFFSRLQPQAMSEDFLMLTADTEFIKTWIERHYMDVIKRALYEIYQVPFTVAIEVNLETPKAKQPANFSTTELTVDNQKNTTQGDSAQYNITTPENINKQAPLGRKNQHENSYYDTYRKPDPFENNVYTADSPASSLTFENFVIGDSNRMAYSMAVAVAETPGKAHLNPLFIYGKSGLGKTHLMRAIQNYIRETMPHMSVIYVDSAELLSDYMEASAAHDKEKSSYKNFKTRYEEADVLLIDDVQYLQGKKQTLDIVFQIFNKITTQGKQVVLSADRAPKNIDIDERYKSRFNSGGTFDIQPPEIETKLGIIKSFIAEYKENEKNSNFTISEDIQMYIAESSSSNIRELKSAITKVISQITFFNQPNLSLEEVRVLLENHFSGGSSRRLTIADIQKEVETFFKVSHADLVGKKRTRDIIYARQIAIYLCRQMLDLPFNDIGKKFNRDHSTVMYSVTNVEEKMKESHELREELETLKQIIREA